ncbi:MAG: xanthine dehydrogenase accessory factor [Acidobacteriota bacterium]|jgi:xanthine/CO dehydrogenase XdhC/CoxF family maturation factor/CTP:molybdopterin cytidylyltransferase MocA|nr:xanthine dehydrogenase accessory factor [Acidobacteriota bacterium]
MELLRILEECRAAGGGDCALATVVETKGSAYRRAGARLLVRRDRKTWGAISGGCLEADIIERALGVIARGEAKLAHFRPAEDDLIVGLGSGCQGELAVLIEPLPEAQRLVLHDHLSSAASDEALITTYRAPSPMNTFIGRTTEAPAGAFVQPIVSRLSLIIFGASPAAEPLLRFAKQLGWCVRIADHRPIVASDERLAAADSIEIAPTEELPSRFTYPAPSAAVVMTHHYLRDLELIRQLAPQRLVYLGLVGSRERAQRLVAEAGTRGIDADLLAASLRAPAGLDLGADAPSEIALSIIAEIQAVLRRTTATALRSRHGRIHNASDESAVVILAAGGSRRLGRPKQLVEIEGQPLVRRAAESALAAGSGSVHVVVGADAVRVRQVLHDLPVEIIVNDTWKEGMASSIRAAIDAIERRERPVETILLMLCDQPGVSGDVLRRLLDAYRATRAPVVASRYPEGPGVPALFHAELFPALKALGGDIGARELIRQLDRDIVTIPFALPEDIDTPADVARYGAPDA